MTVTGQVLLTSTNTVVFNLTSHWLPVASFFLLSLGSFIYHCQGLNSYFSPFFVFVFLGRVGGEVQESNNKQLTAKNLSLSLFCFPVLGTSQNHDSWFTEASFCTMLTPFKVWPPPPPHTLPSKKIMNSCKTWGTHSWSPQSATTDCSALRLHHNGIARDKSDMDSWMDGQMNGQKLFSLSFNYS